MRVNIESLHCTPGRSITLPANSISVKTNTIDKRQLRGAGERACNRGASPGDLGLRDGLPSSQAGWTVAPPRGSVNFRTPPPTVMPGSICRRGSLQSSSRPVWPARLSRVWPARLSRVSVPTSPHQATRRPSRAHPHVLGAPRPSKASPARPSPPAHLLICGPLLCLRPLQPLSPLCPSRLCWAVSSFFPLLLWVPQTVCTLKKKKKISVFHVSAFSPAPFPASVWMPEAHHGNVGRDRKAMPRISPPAKTSPPC